jgi:hypothetical protein
MKILVIGDSFAADWTVKYKGFGWTNLLADQFDVTNLAQAGVSEYKIYKQILSIADLSVFDLIIVSHTSPYRVHTRLHPIHTGDLLHNNADLIYSDIEYHAHTLRGYFNRSLRFAVGFFVHHNDEEYQETVITSEVDFSAAEATNIFAFGYSELKKKLKTLFGDSNVVDC